MGTDAKHWHEPSLKTPGVSSTVMASTQKRTLGIVFFTVFLDLVGFGIIIPIQPFFAERLGASAALVTLLGASFSLMQFLFAPMWGRLSDRIGRKPVMLISIFSTVVGYVAFGLSRTLPALFAARMLAGLGSANIGTAQAIIADSTAPENRAKGMGLIGAAFGLGFIFGPAIGGGLVHFGLQVPAFAAAALSSINWILAVFLLPETRQFNEASPSTRHGFSWHGIKRAARHPGVARLFSIYLTWTLAFAMMEQVLALFIEHTWSGAGGESAATHAAKLTTYVLVVVGVTATIIQGGLIGRLVKRFGERNTLFVGTLATATALALIPVSQVLGSFAFLMVVSVLLAAGSGLTSPSLSSLLSRSVGKDEQGGTLGLGQSLSALGRVIGPAMAGFLFQVFHGLPFFLGAVLTFACAGLVYSIKPRPAV
jgi:DHA1 family tetracycline resistance protein-like MFS transporter